MRFSLPTAKAMAWAVWLLTVALVAADTWIGFTFLSRDVPYHSAAAPAYGLIVVLQLVNSGVGALIVARQPRNAVGWLFLLYSILAPLSDIAGSYAIYGTYLASASLPATALSYRVGQMLSTVSLDSIPYLMLLFPNGRFLTKRWKRVGLAIAPLMLYPLLLLFQTTTDDPNMPAAIEIPGSDQVLFVLSVVGAAGLLASYILGAISVIVRYRRSRGTERLQMKWMVYACALVLASVPTLVIGFLVFVLTLSLIPIAAGIAILRYRLYDIDLLIKRTVIYGTTTAAIAVTFWVGILALQGILSPLTSGSEVAIAASTLVSLALFQPIRRRVQNAVDRRFDRSRYDAARTLDAFAERMRDEVDLDELRAHLVGSVHATMTPAHTSLWLREPGR